MEEEVLAKYFSGEGTVKERQSVEEWRAASDVNAEAFLDAKVAWLASEPMVAPPPHVLEGILAADKEPHEEESGARVVSMNWIYAAAASVVLVVAVVLLFYKNSDGSVPMVTKQELSDGSSVSLYKDASLQLVSFDGATREVKVSGKVYFDIERDESKPFIIHTSNATVKVLGTSFLVESESIETVVSVESGLVELVKKDAEVSVFLEKGEKGLVLASNKGIIKKTNEDLNYLSWKTNVLSFKESKMSDVKRVLEEVYGLVVTFEHSNLEECKLTAKFNKKKPKDVLEIIARTFDLKYELKKGKRVHFTGKGC